MLGPDGWTMPIATVATAPGEMFQNVWEPAPGTEGERFGFEGDSRGQPHPWTLTFPETPWRCSVGGWVSRSTQGLPEPHAATLATVDETGVPDARTLLIKDVDEHGWAVAGLASSRKGRQLAAHPAAALNFWWQPLVRAVRVRGAVVEASRADSDADLQARSAAARADVSPGDWTLWRIQPARVEFWQGSPDRRHHRIIYERDGAVWRVGTAHGEGPTE